MIDLSSIPQVAYEEMNLIHNEDVTLLNNLETAVGGDGQNCVILSTNTFI